MQREPSAEIGPLTAADRPAWEALVRGYHAHFATGFPDETYDQTWRRLIGDDPVHGVAASLDGDLVGFAHYYFHTSVWAPGESRCYLQDLYVAPRTRRHGTAAALVDWIARAAATRGATSLHWHTTETNAAARAFYDTLTTYRGFIAYAIPLTDDR